MAKKREIDPARALELRRRGLKWREVAAEMTPPGRTKFSTGSVCVAVQHYENELIEERLRRAKTAA
jgi:hypothetical protein